MNNVLTTRSQAKITPESTMRTPKDLRIASLIGYGISFAAALMASFVVHLVFGSQGRGGFRDLNLGGLLEILGFVLAFSYAMLLSRRVLKVPVTSLLSAGLIVPKMAASVAQPIEDLENPSHLDLGQGIAVLRQAGRPVGVHDASRDRMTAWEDVLRVPGSTAVTELRDLLARANFVLVTDGEQVRGIITREMYLAGL